MKVVRLFFFMTVSLVYVSCAQEARDNSQTSKTVAEVTPVTIPEGMDVATFAGGCFWCTEAVFERVIGVSTVVSGYAGGLEKNPTYRQVSYGETSHAEAIQILFDPNKITYKELLEVFFATHDPTQLNRQGPDVGKQYRTAVYFHNKEQQQVLEKYISYLTKSGKYANKIVTEQTPFTNFYEAEGYHQDYYEINPYQPYIYNVARPKVMKLLKLFPEKIKEKYQAKK